jgi:hypothetical protein
MTEKKWLSALKPLASAPTQWQAFEDMVDYYISIQQKSLEQANQYCRNTQGTRRSHGS